MIISTIRQPIQNTTIKLQQTSATMTPKESNNPTETQPVIQTHKFLDDLYALKDQLSQVIGEAGFEVDMENLMIYLEENVMRNDVIMDDNNDTNEAS
jgi:hypothetical protein